MHPQALGIRIRASLRAAVPPTKAATGQDTGGADLGVCPPQPPPVISCAVCNPTGISLKQEEVITTESQTPKPFCSKLFKNILFRRKISSFLRGELEIILQMEEMKTFRVPEPVTRSHQRASAETAAPTDIPSGKRLPSASLTSSSHSS